MEHGEIKARLLDKRHQIEKSIARKRDAALNGLPEMTDELSMYDQHPGDIGSETYEREKDAGLLEMLETQLVQVDDALRRLEEGTYGICELCGDTIDEKRLARLPTANLCVTCAGRAQRKFTRPVEEEILNMHEIADKGDTFEVAGYDLFDEYGQSESGYND